MTQRNAQQGKGQAGQSSQPGTQGGSASERRSEQQTNTNATRQQDNQPQETPDEWLEENSLGDPNETGNTITGENEY